MTYKIRHMPTRQLLVEDLEMAVTAAEQRRGLLGRDELAPGAGMLFPKVWSIHTFGMRFAIDVIFADAVGDELAVRRVFVRLPPNRIAGALFARYCLELPPGTLEDKPLRRGDLLRIERHVATSVSAANDQEAAS
jgi:uncharacterized membrane protein (UPF0127 family)